MLFDLIKLGFDVAKYVEEEKERKFIEAVKERKERKLIIKEISAQLKAEGENKLILANLGALEDGVIILNQEWRLAKKHLVFNDENIYLHSEKFL